MRQIAALLLLTILLLPASAPAAARETMAGARAGELVLGLAPGYALSLNARVAGPRADALDVVLRQSDARAALSLGAGSNAYRVRVASGIDIQRLARELAILPGVAYAEPNRTRRLLRASTDPVVRQQWALRNIEAPAAWDVTTGGAIMIAILDTGVSRSHPEFRGRVMEGYDFANRDGDASDDQGHGTYVAGVAAASGDNGFGIAGVCWACTILPVKVLDSQGQGDDATIAEGMRYAVDRGARIISMSLGGDEETQVLRDAAAYAHERGALVIAASGNGQADGNRASYPAAFPNVLAVSATDGADVVTGFATTGDFVDISAPGVGVWSTAWIDGRGDTYEASNGTSAACPYVAGAAALALSIRPDLSVDQLAALLQAAADDRGAPGRDPEHGAGRLNLLRTVQLAQNPQAIPAPQQAVQAPAPADDIAARFAPEPPPADGARYFPETGHSLRGAFRGFWEAHGGLPIFGFPISAEFNERGEDGREYLVQYFERHRFEYHPENPAPYNVLLSRLGVSTLERGGRDWTTFGKGARNAGCVVFEATGQSLCEPFLSYWHANGLELDGLRGKSAAESLALFGMPISAPQAETLPDGGTYMVQWFERARFEDHGAQGGVLLGLLSADLARSKGWR
jgi:thermitase